MIANPHFSLCPKPSRNQTNQTKGSLLKIAGSRTSVQHHLTRSTTTFNYSIFSLRPPSPLGPWIFSCRLHHNLCLYRATSARKDITVQLYRHVQSNFNYSNNHALYESLVNVPCARHNPTAIGRLRPPRQTTNITNSPWRVPGLQSEFTSQKCFLP